MKKLLTLLLIVTTSSIMFAQKPNVKGNQKLYNKVFNKENELLKLEKLGNINDCFIINCFVFENIKTKDKNKIYCFTTYRTPLLKSTNVYYSKEDIENMVNGLETFFREMGPYSKETLSVKVCSSMIRICPNQEEYSYYPDYINSPYFIEMNAYKTTILYAILRHII